MRIIFFPVKSFLDIFIRYLGSAELLDMFNSKRDYA